MGVINKLRKKTHKMQTSQTEMTRVIHDTFKSLDLMYEYLDNDHVFTTIVHGNNIPVPLIVHIEEYCIHMVSLLELEYDPRNLQETLLKMNSINSELSYGAFYLEPESKMMVFEYRFPYCETKVNTDYVGTFIGMVVRTMDGRGSTLKAIAEKKSSAECEAMYN